MPAEDHRSFVRIELDGAGLNWLRDLLDDAARHADGFGFLVVVIAVLFALSSMMYACATFPGSLQ